jgi:hypothetical protein
MPQESWVLMANVIASNGDGNPTGRAGGDDHRQSDAIIRGQTSALGQISQAGDQILQGRQRGHEAEAGEKM